MQGEGQEFESPRLHHLRPRRPPERSSVPLIRVLGDEATDQRTAGGHKPELPPLGAGANLTNWKSDRQKEKSF